MSSKNIIKIISHSNQVILEKIVIKYTWLTENKIEIYDENDTKSVIFIHSFLVIIEEVKEG